LAVAVSRGDVIQIISNLIYDVVPVVWIMCYVCTEANVLSSQLMIKNVESRNYVLAAPVAAQKVITAFLVAF
jgi:hypothetical protein